MRPVQPACLQSPVVRRARTGDMLRLEPSVTHGRGGEAVIIGVAGTPSLVAKVYHRDRLSARALIEREAKVRAMLAAVPACREPRPSVAWPVDLLHDDRSGKFVGFLMPRVSGGLLWHQLADPIDRLRLASGVSFDFLLATAANLCDAVAAVHAAGHVVGDVNPNNAIVHRDALVTLVDADSFQVATPGGRFPCPAGMPPYVAPEVVAAAGPRGDYAAVARTPASDVWAVAVLLHELLTGGADPTVPRTQAPVPQAAPEPHPADALSPDLRALFVRCFGGGHSTPGARPTTAEWARVCRAAAQDLVTCRIAPSHRHGRHLLTCPHCSGREATGIDLYPEPEVVRLGRQLQPYGWRATTGARRPRQMSGKAPAPAAAAPTTRKVTAAGASARVAAAPVAGRAAHPIPRPPSRAVAPRRQRAPAPNWVLTVAVLLLATLAALRTGYPPAAVPTAWLAAAAAIAATYAALRPPHGRHRTPAVLTLLLSAALVHGGIGDRQWLTRQVWRPAAELAWAAHVPAPLAARLGEPRGVALARAALAGGDTTRAQEHLGRALAIRPDAAAAHAITGRIAFEQRRLAVAQVALTRAADLSQWDPTTSPESLLLLARTLCQRGKFDLGTRLLRHARRQLAAGHTELAPATAAECDVAKRSTRR